MASKEKFYVYAIMDGPTVLYVGKGSGYRANASARKNGGKAVILERFKNESEAFRREVDLIAELLPQNNLCAGGNGGRVAPADPNALPKMLHGVVTKAQWLRHLKQDRDERALVEKVGLRKYAAQFLCRKLDHSNCEKWGVSKVDMSRLREVAHG